MARNKTVTFNNSTVSSRFIGSGRSLLLATACLAAYAGIATSAAAADQAEITRMRVNSLQAQVNELVSQIQDLQKPEAPKGQTRGAVLETGSHQLIMAGTDGATTLQVTGRLHLDFGGYPSVSPQGGYLVGQGPNSATKATLADGVNVRRARIGVQGKFLGDFAYQFIYDFGGSGESLVTGQAGAPTSAIEAALITFNGWYKPTNPVPLAIDLGYQDVPWTLEESISSNDIMFLERSTPQTVATAFGAGDFRSSFGVRSNDTRYFVDAYVTGPANGGIHTISNTTQGSGGEPIAFLGRGSYQLWVNPVNGDNLHLGFNVAYAAQMRTGANSAIISLSDRPELRIDPTALLTTGNIYAKDGTVLGAELAGQFGNWFAMGEYFHDSIEQKKLTAASLIPTLNFDGGYGAISYTFGGKRAYKPAAGSYTGVVPDANFSLTKGTPGAFELAARYSSLDLNDHVIPGKTQASTGGVYGGKQENYTFGINWYPNTSLKFMINYIHSDLSKFATNGVTPVGAKIDAIAGRAQFVF